MHGDCVRKLFALFDASDIPAVVLILGFGLLGYGASQFHPGLGQFIVGALMVFYVRPLVRWVK